MPIHVYNRVTCMESFEHNKIKTINLEQSSKVYFLSLLFCCGCSSLSLSLSLSLSHLYDFVGYMITKRIVKYQIKTQYFLYFRVPFKNYTMTTTSQLPSERLKSTCAKGRLGHVFYVTASWFNMYVFETGVIT